jgi:hypothetical protein
MISIQMSMKASFQALKLVRQMIRLENYGWRKYLTGVLRKRQEMGDITGFSLQMVTPAILLFLSWNQDHSQMHQDVLQQLNGRLLLQ